MVKQKILGLGMVSAAVLVGVLGVAAGCDDAKKVPDSGVPARSGSAEAPVAPTPSAQKSAAAPSASVAAMVRIPGGSFQMGSNDGQPDEKPVKTVQVPSFEMDITEVTIGEYRLCVDSQKCTTPDLDHFCNWDRPSKEDHPINCVDWDQATAYCASVGKRLPTEEEWEYAARGKDGRAYPWGNAPPPPADVCWARIKSGTCPSAAVPVDSPFGLRGMAGNVWEWTASGYSEDYNKKREKERRVYRGGSFYEEKAEHMRATTRNRRATTLRLDYLGFRCARTPGKDTK